MNESTKPQSSPEPKAHKIQAKKMTDITPRVLPVQGRSRKRAQQIIEASACLLERVGFDDLNTVNIATEVGISVGALYHYFPNKYAIMHAMGQQWLDEIASVLQQYHAWDIESMALEDVVRDMIDLNFSVYKKQKAQLTLVQAMFAIPELRELDAQHDDMVILNVAGILKRLKLKKQRKERLRLARLYHELTHALFLVMLYEKGDVFKRSKNDLNVMVCSFLRPYL